jgi:DNA mismatch endonuclease (patch repair protein)
MSRIRSKDTKPELLVRKYLFSRGLRFRVNVSRIPGHPDIVLTKYNALIEVRGCFWHRHEGCATATSPKSHVRFWREKFKRNVARDKLHEEQWAAAGWRVFIVWECELRPFVREITLAKLYAAIVGNTDFTYPEEEQPAIPLAAESTADYKA